MWRNDPFDFCRSVLFCTLTLYYIVTTGVAGWHVARLLAGNDPHKRLLRVYLSYQLVSVRLKPLAGELVQIVFWCLVLIAVWWAHPAR